MAPAHLRDAVSVEDWSAVIYTDSGRPPVEGSCERPLIVDPTQSVVVIIHRRCSGVPPSFGVFLSFGLLPWLNACLRPPLTGPFPGTNGRKMG